MNLIQNIFIIMLPVVIMVIMIPFVTNDYLLTLLYLIIIIPLLCMRKDARVRIILFIFGCCMMTMFEALFISTGVETFMRNSLFGIMPLWLPVLWGYGFVAIHEGTSVLTKELARK